MAKPLLALLCLLAAPCLQAAEALVRRVVDGDTLLLDSGERVRLIGVDSPESHPSSKLKRDARGSKVRAEAIRELGRDASRFVKAVVEGRTVRIETDPVNTSTRHRDRYGRLLAYVYFEPDDCEDLELWLADAACDTEAYEDGFLNALIIEAGFAVVYTRAPFQFSDRFRALERAAREEERGLWGPDPLQAYRQEPAYAAR